MKHNSQSTQMVKDKTEKRKSITKMTQKTHVN